MLTITTGEFRGHRLQQPNTTKTRPVTEKNRHAIFQVLGDMHSLSVLDLYAGSGALGLEALSLGASSAVFVDMARVAISAIKQNIQTLGVTDQTQVFDQKVETFLQTDQQLFDVIFFDPPYTAFEATLLEQAGAHLKPEGILVVSCSSKIVLGEYTAIQTVKQKIYGDTQIAYFRKSSLV